MQPRYIDTLNKTNDMRILRNILEMKSWKKDFDQTSGNNISLQKIFVNGKFRMVNEFIDLSKIDNNSLDNWANIMYIGLVCMCSESINTILRSHLNENEFQNLIDVNVIVVKTIYNICISKLH